MIRKVNLLLATLLFATASTISAQESQDIQLAKSYFNELDSLCAIDSGSLWGLPLYGPTLLVNSDTRLIIANHSDKDKQLMEREGVYIGTLPENINISNTAITWNGQKWTMVMWDAIPQNDKYSRAKLLIHESWHRVEHDLGIESESSSSIYLDELQGAILMKLELMALRHALLDTTETQQRADLENALVIRRYRQTMFPRNNENEFERNEGMAEYTGFKLCGLNGRITQRVLAKQLELSMNKDGFANSFAYLTGPAYGFLFDNLKPGWIKQVIQGEDLPQITLSIVGIQAIPADTVRLKSMVSDIVKAYQAESLVKSDSEKFAQQKLLVLEYRHKIFEGSQLIIPNLNSNLSYNPQEKLIPINGLGVIYKTGRLTGDWGILEVTDGIFRSNDWRVFMVPAPQLMNSKTLKEAGYTLTLNEGWKIVKVKEGKFTLRKE